ncbi:hypothetical protein ACWPKO_29955 (plasmid) [Coraliomargarita sp. W4R53]
MTQQIACKTIRKRALANRAGTVTVHLRYSLDMTSRDPFDGTAWHYTTAAGLDGIVSNHCLRASSAAFMNDSRELLTGQQALSDLLEKRRPDFAEWQIRQLRFTGIGQAPDVFGNFLVCAAAESDLLTVWRNYGGDEIAYAIGLDASSPLAPIEQVAGEEHPSPPQRYYDDAVIDLGGGDYESHDPDEIRIAGGTWRTVEYIGGPTDVVVRREFDALLDELVEPPAGENRVPWRLVMASLAGSPTNFWKDRGFHDEREVRSAWNVAPSWKFVKYRAHRFGLVPYIEVGALVNEASVGYVSSEARRAVLPIREVMIGPTAYVDAARKALRGFLDDAGYGDVQISHSITPFR